MGALRALGEQNLHTVFTEGVYGISIGAVLCSLIAFQFTLSEIETFCADLLRLDAFLEPPRLAHVLTLPTRMGLDTGEKAVQTWKSMFAAKGLDLDTLTIGDAAIPLHIVATDLTRRKIVVFDDHVRVVDALRASTALPLIFCPHILKGRVFVDGAVLCKNLLNLIPASQRHTVLALFLDSPEPEVTSLSDLLQECMSVASRYEVGRAARAYPQNVCRLIHPSVTMLDPEPDVLDMFAVGERLARNFMKEYTNTEHGGEISGARSGEVLQGHFG